MAIQIFDAQKYFNVSAASLFSYTLYFICSGNGIVRIQNHVELFHIKLDIMFFCYLCVLLMLLSFLCI